MKDLTGQRFGRLVVTGLSHVSQRSYWRCICDCGNPCVVCGSKLINGNTKSCGCLKKSILGTQTTTHGETRTRLYRIWQGMRRRCNDSNNPKYINYGARGIYVCEEWQRDYTTFRDWALSNGYTQELSIDRIDNDGPYSPENCRWTTNAQQSVNKQNSIVVEYHGRVQPLSIWCKELGLKYGTVWRRLAILRWPTEKAFSTKRYLK